MKKILFFSLVALSLYSCKKTSEETSAIDAVSVETKAKISALGFSTANVHKTADGYLVEGDILLNDEVLNSTPDQSLLRIAENEQYRTLTSLKVYHELSPLVFQD